MEGGVGGGGGIPCALWWRRLKGRLNLMFESKEVKASVARDLTTVIDSGYLYVSRFFVG